MAGDNGRPRAPAVILAGVRVMPGSVLVRAARRRVATRRRATCALSISGQLSTPAAVIRCTALRSPPMMPVSGDTSLATIQSQPLALRFLLGVVDARSRSRRRSRSPAAAALGARRRWSRGCRDSRSARARAAPRALFLIFSRPARRRASRQRRQRTRRRRPGSAASHRRPASRAPSRRRCAHARRIGAALTGPETSVTSAPSAAAAAAMAEPCLPDERLAM